MPIMLVHKATIGMVPPSILVHASMLLKVTLQLVQLCLHLDIMCALLARRMHAGFLEHGGLRLEDGGCGGSLRDLRQHLLGRVVHSLARTLFHLRSYLGEGLVSDLLSVDFELDHALG